MKNINVVFKIINEKNCPLYSEGELLVLTDKTLSCPEGKEVCLILVRDMTQLLFTFLQDESFDNKDYLTTQFNCSGCSGLIKFSLIDQKEDAEGGTRDGAVAPIQPGNKEKWGGIVDSPFLKILSPEQIDPLFNYFHTVQLEKDGVLIFQGQQNLNLYIVTEGELVVEDNGLQLATLKEGEICGEMSYLGADVAVSTVRALSATKVLAIGGEQFALLLGDDSKVQAFMAKLLAKRLQKTNAARSRDFEACMSGRVDEIVPAELFQIFHMHQKTGVLKLDLMKGSGHVSFREGCIINARYNNEINEEAIFQILIEKSGWYRFTTGLSPQDMKAAEIGDFMMLLMEGVKRVDEDLDR